MNPTTREPIRWWPAAVIVTLMALLLAWIWLAGDGSNRQDQVMPTLPVLFFGALLLLAWLVLFSRAPWRVRLSVLAAVIFVTGLGTAFLEIKGVSGNLVPVVGLRGSEREFDTSSRAATPVAEPGPGDWPQFYGRQRMARVDDVSIGRDWKANAPRELWRREVGAGMSSFAIVGPAAVTQELRGENEAIVRYDLASGDQVWVHAYRAPFNTTIGGSGPRATPTIDDGEVFALGATGTLSCVDLDSGSLRWSRNVREDHGVDMPEWGMASSPLVVGAAVIVQLGRRGHGSAAYDRGSGEPLWRAADEDGGTYSSPLPATVGGFELALIVYRERVVGHDPLTGEVRWAHEWPNPGGTERVSMPLVLDDGRILVSAGYGAGSRMLQAQAGADGPTSETLWDSPRLKSKFAPMVYHDGAIFGLDDGVLVAVDPATGERFWKRGRYGHGQFVLVGDLLLIVTEDGELVLVEADAERHNELARIRAVSGRTWNPPALSDRILLVRNDREAVAYELPSGG
ncbi:MAG: PQQ-binding-like beta-propeller repeat protein [bacterium]|nr:PQQ-binding-like beta-propeller repeat protein [bacterium]